ncbi:MAG TPA: fumarate hydratase, partial [Bordetella sp.]|nr:fumarate hydratase [Bordetella sp.]
MRTIPAEHIVASIASALQWVSHHHPPDFVRALKRAYQAETHAAARNALLQLLVNSKLAAQARRPVCQDTGIAHVYFRMGMDVRISAADGQRTPSLQALANRAVALAYTDAANPLRASVIRDPLGTRINTRDNTPAIVHVELVEGDRLDITVAAKGGGGDAKARYAMLTPSDPVADWVVQQLPGMGAGWCPPAVLGIGVGGTPELAMHTAKRALFEPIDIDALHRRGATDAQEQLRLDLYTRINALGIGAQGLGGDTTVLDVKVAALPSHAALLPVAVVPGCAATRHISFEQGDAGPVVFVSSDPALWHGVPDQMPMAGTQVDLDTLTPQQVAGWRAGQQLLLSGRLLTARDAAHKRLADLLRQGAALPVSLRGRALYYVGPVDAVGG